MSEAAAAATRAAPPGSALEVLAASARLGLTSFGGPIAHLAYYRAEYVERRRWLDERAFADLVALCQFLPGPASTQVNMGVGMLRAGLPGAAAAWLGFALPSAILMVAFAWGIARLGPGEAGWLHGLKVVAVAVVAQAVWGMARTLAVGRARATIAALAGVVVTLWPGALGQVAVIGAAGLAGTRLFREAGAAGGPRRESALGRRGAVVALALFFALLAGLPLLRALRPGGAVGVADGFYRAGALVFGGGHVVLPLLQAEVVPPGWVTNAEFVAGYGAAQALPGPLFAFAAYLGAVMAVAPGGLAGAALALVAIFLPGALLIVGALPFWDRLRAHAGCQGALQGVNAAVVGLLLAALYHPVWTSAIHRPSDFALAVGAFALLAFWRLAPWLVVGLTAAGGAALAALGV